MRHEQLQDALEVIARLTAEREAAVLEAQTARRVLAIEQTLNDPTVKLPLAWKTDLREKLTDAAPEQWGGIIASHQKMATSAGHKPSVAVSGAGQQVSPPALVVPRVDPMVRARQRLAEASSPEDLKRIQEALGR